MTGDLDIRGSASLQDVDLFSRLNQYFDVLDQHLRAGHGWFIFNAAGSRSRRIGAFILSRLAPYQPFVSTYVVPWRDFSLNAYMVEIELQTIAQREGELEGKAKTEFDIATRVSRDSMVKMVVSDLLIVTELRPTAMSCSFLIRRWSGATISDSRRSSPRRASRRSWLPSSPAWRRRSPSGTGSFPACTSGA
jgi:hypothetical protein